MRQANAIVIGGPIAVGKSTLVGSLPFDSIQELETNDELQTILLEQMYAGDIIAKQVFQLDILLTRFDKYKQFANRETLTVFDRSIFEDKIFAWFSLQDTPHVWEYYHGIWHDKVDEIMKEIGVPKLYILLTCNWEVFRERIFSRNRAAEVENFQKNESYFRKVLDSYRTMMIETFHTYNLPYVEIDTNDKNKLEIIAETFKILQERGIYQTHESN